MKRRTFIDFAVLLAVVVTGFVAIQNATAIGDWWYFLSYKPSEQVVQIAEDAGMSELGTKLFYRLDPQFVGRGEINQKCGSDALGCAVDRNIYILDEFTPRLYNRSVVTAAHEMLHVSYSRMNKNELESLKTALDEQIDQVSDNLYDKFDEFTGEDYYNEAHSYIGTEQANLTSELKTNYQEFFSDRKKTLEALRYSPER